MQPQPPQHPRQRNAGVSVNFPPSVNDSSHKVFVKTPRGGRPDGSNEVVSFVHQAGPSKKGGEYISAGIPPAGRGHHYQPYQQLQQQQQQQQQFQEQQQRQREQQQALLVHRAMILLPHVMENLRNSHAGLPEDTIRAEATKLVAENHVQLNAMLDRKQQESAGGSSAWDLVLQEVARRSDEKE